MPHHELQSKHPVVSFKSRLKGRAGRHLHSPLLKDVNPAVLLVGDLHGAEDAPCHKQANAPEIELAVGVNTRDKTASEREQQ